VSIVQGVLVVTAYLEADGGHSSPSKINKQNERHTMQIILKYATRTLMVSAAVIALASMTPFSARGAEQMKGAQHLLHLQNLKTVGDVEALKPDDTFAMACGKCKTIFVTKVINTAKGAEVLAAGGKPTQVIGTHACPGCGSTMEIVGHGKAKEAKLTHTCKACGDDSAFCCATKPGSAQTKGMDKK
jgi:hypothetical protein